MAFKLSFRVLVGILEAKWVKGIIFRGITCGKHQRDERCDILKANKCVWYAKEILIGEAGMNV